MTRIVTGFKDIDNLGLMTLNIEQLQRKIEGRLDDIFFKYQEVAVACSGGLDSTTLFAIFCEIAKRKKKFKLSLTHVNFKLRGAESDEDQLFVENLAKENNLPIYLYSVTSADQELKNGQGTQEWARNIRLRYFHELAAKGCLIALAHHMDDMAETVLMRLARGTSPEKLKPMTEYCEPFWRPFLEIGRSRIENIADLLGLSHREDSSNVKMDYCRNRFRKKVIPEIEALYPGASKKIVMTSKDASELASYVKDSMKSELDKWRGKVPVEFFLNKPDAVAFLGIRLMLEREGLHTRQFSRAVFSSMIDAVHECHGTHKPWNCRLTGDVSFFYQNGFVWTEKGSQVQKAARAIQHQKGLRLRPLGVLTDPDSHCKLFLD